MTGLVVEIVSINAALVAGIAGVLALWI